MGNLPLLKALKLVLPEQRNPRLAMANERLITSPRSRRPDPRSGSRIIRAKVRSLSHYFHLTNPHKTDPKETRSPLMLDIIEMQIVYHSPYSIMQTDNIYYHERLIPCKFAFI